MDRRVDLAIAVATMLFGAFVLIVAQSIRPFGPVVDPLGPSAFPIIIGSVLVLSGGALAVQRLVRWRTESSHMVAPQGELDEPGIPSSALRAFTIMGLSFAYVLTLPILGYLIGTPLFVSLALRAMGVRWLVVALGALVYSVLTYLVFSLVVRVRLPLGPLTDILRELGLSR